MSWSDEYLRKVRADLPEGWSAEILEDGELLQVTGPDEFDAAPVIEHYFASIEQPMTLKYSLVIPDAAMLPDVRRAAAKYGLEVVLIGRDRYRVLAVRS